MTKEALKLALEALKENHYYMIDAGLPNQSMLNKGFAAFKACEQALAAPVQEPVYLVEDDFGLFRITNKGDYIYWSSTGRHKTFIANATPPAAQHKPLTDEQMYEAVRPLCRTDSVARALVEVSKDEYQAIEAAHGIGEKT